jgi:hypothetical protein
VESQSLSDPVPLTSQRGEEDDEELVQNRSIEETTQSLPVLSETENNGELLKPASLATRQAQDGNSSGQLVNCVSDQSESAMDQNRKLSLSETAAASGKCSSQESSPAEEWLSEEEKRKRSNKAEVKSWLLERMQAPIQSECSQAVCVVSCIALFQYYTSLSLSADMLLSTEEKSKTPPMFLCFKVGKPMRKSFIIGRTSSPAHTRGKQPEYWFAVPQER